MASSTAPIPAARRPGPACSAALCPTSRGRPVGGASRVRSVDPRRVLPSRSAAETVFARRQAVAALPARARTRRALPRPRSRAHTQVGRLGRDVRAHIRAAGAVVGAVPRTRSPICKRCPFLGAFVADGRDSNPMAGALDSWSLTVTSRWEQRASRRPYRPCGASAPARSNGIHRSASSFAARRTRSAARARTAHRTKRRRKHVATRRRERPRCQRCVRLPTSASWSRRGLPRSPSAHRAP